MKEETRRFWLGQRQGSRFVVWLVLYTLLMLTIGYGWAVISDRAFGAEAAVPVQTSQQVPTCGQDVECSTYVKRFKAGKMGRDSGFRPGNVFKHPKKARKVWVHKIARYLENHPKQWANLRAARPALAAETPSCYPASTCAARDLYQQSTSGATCVAGGYPANYKACDSPFGGRSYTEKQVRIGGSVVLCGGGVVLGARAGGGVFAAIWGGAGCAWAFWWGMKDD